MNDTPVFRVIDIIRGTTVDGPGFRTAIYLAGCGHHCPGCHNPKSWSASEGHDMSLLQILDIVKEEDFDVTLTGGDPLFLPEKTKILAKAIKESGYGVWLYTGYTMNEIKADGRLSAVLPFVDAVVDGRYVEEMRNPDLLFRGSSNQNIIMSPFN